MGHLPDVRALAKFGGLWWKIGYFNDAPVFKSSKGKKLNPRGKADADDAETVSFNLFLWFFAKKHFGWTITTKLDVYDPHYVQLGWCGMDIYHFFQSCMSGSTPQFHVPFFHKQPTDIFSFRVAELGLQECRLAALTHDTTIR